MMFDELRQFSTEEETIKFTALFGGTFFSVFLGESVYEKNKICYRLPDYESARKLIKESVEKKQDLLEGNLSVVKGQNT